MAKPSGVAGRNLASVPALERGIQILDYMKDLDGGVTFSEICIALKLPKSSAYRIVTTLLHHGLLEQQDGSSYYYLGYKILVLSKGAIRHSNLARTALPFLRKLAHDVEETVKLSVMRDRKIFVIEKVDSPLRFKISMDAGVYPIHAGGASKLLLAYADQQTIESVLSAPLERYTPNTITNAEELRRNLNRIRIEDYAEDNEEYIEGLKAVAFPVRNYAGTLVAAVSIPYLAVSETQERLTLLKNKLAESAREISNALGFNP